MKNFSARDLYRHRKLGSLQGSPRHPRLVVQVGRALEKEDAYERTLWTFDETDTGLRCMTSALFGASSPAWSADGEQLAFLSQRQKLGKQVYLLRMCGGEARLLTRTKDETLKAIEGWSPAADVLLVLAGVPWREDGEDEPPHDARKPQVARFLPYKLDGEGITVSERTHLFRIDAATGATTTLTSGDFDVFSAVWSSDGKRIAYVRNRTARQRHRRDVWVCDADGAHPRLLIDALASVNAIAWSPDDRSLAVIGSAVEGDSRSGLWLASSHDGSLRQVGGEDFEVEAAGGVHWHPDGDRVVVVDVHCSLQSLAIVHVADDRITRFDIGLRLVTSASCQKGRIAFVAASMRKPEELFSIEWTGEGLRRHSRFNSRWVSRRARPRVVKRRFSVPDGEGGSERIDAWLLVPPGAKPPYPLLVDMHGGPHSAVLVDYSAHAYWYLLASRGWAIVAPNAVGSQGFGRRFSERLRANWGRLDLPQFEAVVRQLQAEGLADDRVVCTGKSYGGYLSAWAIGHSGLFKAAIVCAPVANIESHYGTSDTGYYVTPFAMRGESDAHLATYQDLSPIRYTHRATAPTLILQGENDGRCPRGQSEELFASLIRNTEVPVELVVYPTSTHAEAESGRPSNRIDYHSRIADWAVRWGNGSSQEGHIA